MTTTNEARLELADAAGIILNDAVRDVDRTEGASDLSAVIARMIERDATDEEWARLAHALGAAGAMAVAAELRTSVSSEQPAGPAVSLLASLVRTLPN